MTPYRYRHYEKLLRHVRQDGISVRHTNADPLNPYSSGSDCYSMHQSIWIGRKGYLRIRILVLAHEYGHCLSRRRGGGLTLGHALFRIKDAKHERVVVAEEHRAFRMGFAALKKLKIPIDPEMLHARRVLMVVCAENELTGP